MEIYYDGMNIEKYKDDSAITGFTTNCSILSTSPDKNYRVFYQQNKDFFNNKAVSLQIWEDDYDIAVQQIADIYSIDPTVFIKIPIVNTKGENNTRLIQFALEKHTSVNVTAIYTMDQIELAYDLLKESTAPHIVSIFAGPISDTCVDPAPFVIKAVELFKAMSNVKILWAGCREIYTVERAKQLGCHIITIPDGVIEKLKLKNYSLLQLSIERVKKFNGDAVTSGLTIL
jgi:transaldolase